MNTRKRIKTALIFAVAAMAVFAGPAQAALLAGELGVLSESTLAGNNPATGVPWVLGDTYRLAFFTSTTRTAESADIADYNTWVQGLADASTAYNIGAVDGATWNVIGSTATVDARDNTSTNPTVNGVGEAIFLLDGATVVANNYADLWDGEIQNIIDITEQGNVLIWWPWTGTYLDGTATGPLGNGGQVVQGRSDITTEWIWRVNTMDPDDYQHNMYALSDPLVIVMADPDIPTVDAGVDMITWSGREVQLAPTVVNNDTTVPQRPLSYLWSAEPVDGVVFSDETAEAPTVTITKATANPSVVTLTLAVTLEGEEPVLDAMMIDVYDDACTAAEGIGSLEFDPTDLDRNCITNLADFAELAAAWLVDYELTEPVPK